jgi:hypothetical protein
MGLKDNPIVKSLLNQGSQPVNWPTRSGEVGSQVNQIRGVSANKSTGPGIPKHVKSVTAAMSNAAKGSTSTVAVTFRRDPSDKNFSGVGVFVKGYQGNQSLVQIGGGSDSPITVLLNNTGEAVTLVVQAQGNSGAAPITTAPSTAIRLPKSTSGGFGTGSQGGYNPGNPPPATVVLPNAQVGDIIRFNTAGDGTWDAVNHVQSFISVVPMGGSIATYGATTGGTTDVPGTPVAVNPTSTSAWGRQLTSSSVASTNTVVGAEHGTGGNSTLIGMNAFYRMSIKLKTQVLTNARWWVGLGCWSNGSSAGHNNVVLINSTAYASDSPNKTTIGFRYSNGVDTHWQAVTCIGGGSQTNVDTGITPDTTNPHVFEIAWNAAKTAVNFFIDGKNVATISTNLPNPANAADAWGGMFLTADNKNTATSVQATWYGMHISVG